MEKRKRVDESALDDGAATKLGSTLVVRRLKPKTTEQDLLQLFHPKGKVTDVRLIFDSRRSNRCVGVAYVEMASAVDADAALELDGAELLGSTIAVTSMRAQSEQRADAPTSSATEPPLETVDAPDAPWQRESLDSFSEGRDGQVGKVTIAQRTSLIARLADSRGVSVSEETRKVAASAGLGRREAGLPRCIVLKNMFDRLSEAAQSDPTFFPELVEDVASECRKLGRVLHCDAERWSNGFVYVKALTHDEACRIKDRMDGRWFAGNKVIVNFVDEALYNKKFSLT